MPGSDQRRSSQSENQRLKEQAQKKRQAYRRLRRHKHGPDRSDQQRSANAESYLRGNPACGLEAPLTHSAKL
jgi:hypothetical protein